MESVKIFNLQPLTLLIIAGIITFIFLLAIIFNKEKILEILEKYENTSTKFILLSSGRIFVLIWLVFLYYLMQFSFLAISQRINLTLLITAAIIIPLTVLISRHLVIDRNEIYAKLYPLVINALMLLIAFLVIDMLTLYSEKQIYGAGGIAIILNYTTSYINTFLFE